MPISTVYRRQVTLLIRALPIIGEHRCFALKGGTAINLFIRNMPRLSVDIDLTYVPVQSREDSLRAIDAAMTAIARVVRKTITSSVHEVRNGTTLTKLNLQSQDAQIKIEVTPVMRGCVFEPVGRRVSPAVEDAFGFAEVPVVSFADLYGGKIVAALDRQHPRDFFDIADLLANEGITDDIRRAFIAYLLSHNRPMHEVLSARPKPLHAEFIRGFEGMTERAVTVADLERARDALVATVIRGMPREHRQFLISFERGNPEWALLGLPHVAQLPAVRWRQQNLDALPVTDRAALVERLERVLSQSQ